LNIRGFFSLKSAQKNSKIDRILFVNIFLEDLALGRHINSPVVENDVRKKLCNFISKLIIFHSKKMLWEAIFMVFFSAFLLKILPLYLNILLGYLAGKLLDAQRETIARIMLYLVNPIVIFNGVLQIQISANVLFLPIVTFLISSMLCLGFFSLSKRIWSDSTRSLVAFSAGSGNTGYFGIPLALLIFNEQGEGLYIMALLGITFFENTLGFYIFTRGTHSAIESVRKLIKLPALYALALGLLLNISEMPVPGVFVEFMQHIKGTYTVLGMMIIGLALSGLTDFRLDFKFIGMTFFAKFIVWPVAILLLIYIDVYLFEFFSESIYSVLMLIAIVPLAANMVIMASLLKSHPEKAATAVLVSTLFALFYVPLMAAYFII